MWSRFGWSFGVACLVSSVASVAWAQGVSPPPAPSPPAPAPSAAGPAAGNASTETPTPAPAATECFPKCRSSYTCYQGQCVSLCNPVCASGERCTAAGECEREPPPPTPAAAPSLSPAPPPASPVEPTASPRAQAPTGVEPSALRPPGTFVFAAHAGLLLTGGGHVEDECSSTRVGGCNGTFTFDTRDKSPVVLGVDGLFHVAPGLRLGVGYWLLPRSALGADPNQAKTHSYGNEHSLHAVLEGVVPLRPKLALAIRAQGGLHVLTVGGDLARENDAFLASCLDRSTEDHCEGMKGPFFGGQYGGTAGVLIGGRLRARLDLGVERYAVKVADQKIESATGTNQERASMYGTRFWFLTGIEL